MQEEYLINKMLKSKTDKELEEELMRIISETKRILEVARCNFEFAEDELIDYYVYQIKAHQSRLDYLIKIAKSKKIKVDREAELKSRIFDKKNIFPLRFFGYTVILLKIPCYFRVIWYTMNIIWKNIFEVII